jgi:hypothetical protein
MFEGLKNARREFFDLLLPDGVDPLYFGTVGLMILVLINWKYYQRWDDLPKDQRGILRALLFVTAIGVIGSILQLTGAI